MRRNNVHHSETDLAEVGSATHTTRSPGPFCSYAGGGCSTLSSTKVPFLALIVEAEELAMDAVSISLSDQSLSAEKSPVFGTDAYFGGDVEKNRLNPMVRLTDGAGLKDGADDLI